MNTLNPAPISKRQFTWNPKAHEYVGEISSTHGFGQVWDDSCDEGLTLVSDDGHMHPFVVESTHRDVDGGILFWVLSPADGSTPRFVRIQLFND